MEIKANEERRKDHFFCVATSLVMVQRMVLEDEDGFGYSYIFGDNCAIILEHC